MKPQRKIDPPFVRNPYNYDTAEASHESGLTCKDETLTKQSFAEDADINTIVRRFALTGELPKNVRMPTYGDFTGISTYHEAMNAIKIAEESFLAMPAETRNRFDNDAGKFIDFVNKEENREEAEKMGLLIAKAPKQDERPKQGAEDTTPPKTPQKPPEGAKTDTKQGVS